MGTSKFRRLNITLPEEIYKDFIKFCDVEGMNLSSRIAVLIKRDIAPGKSLRFRRADVIESSALTSKAQKKLARVFRK